MKYNKILLVKTELEAPLNSRFILYKGDILFCEDGEENSYVLKEFIYGFNEKKHLIEINQNLPPWKKIQSLYDGLNLIPIQILIRDGFLEDITRDYKIEKILE